MFIGALRIQLLILNAQNLKEKRRVLQMLIDRVRNKFNASIAEVDSQDLWQRSTIGVCILGTDKQHVNRSLSKVVELISHFPPVNLLDYELEIF